MNSKNHKSMFIVLASVFLAIAFLALPLNLPIEEAKAQETPKSKIQIVPAELTIGQLGVSLPTPIIKVNITASNVTDLYAWQTTIIYNEEILSFENLTDLASNFPPDNIFGTITPRFLVPQVVKVDLVTHRSIIKIGGMILGDVHGINGSGLLAQLNFKGESTGATDLTFEVGKLDDPDTYFINSTSDAKSIPDELAGAKVMVLGNGISLAFSSKEIIVGESIDITGSLFPQEITNVTISYRTYTENSTGDWQTVTTVQTQKFDVNDTYWEARFSYTWTPEKEGTYQLKVEGGGYTSQLVKVIVNPGVYIPQLGIEFYGPITGIVAFGAVGFFLWDRRRRHSGRLILP